MHIETDKASVALDKCAMASMHGANVMKRAIMQQCCLMKLTIWPPTNPLSILNARKLQAKVQGSGLTGNWLGNGRSSAKQAAWLCMRGHW